MLAVSAVKAEHLDSVAFLGPVGSVVLQGPAGSQVLAAHLGPAGHPGRAEYPATADSPVYLACLGRQGHQVTVERLGRQASLVTAVHLASRGPVGHPGPAAYLVTAVYLVTAASPGYLENPARRGRPVTVELPVRRASLGTAEHLASLEPAAYQEPVERQLFLVRQVTPEYQGNLGSPARQLIAALPVQAEPVVILESLDTAASVGLPDILGYQASLVRLDSQERQGLVGRPVPAVFQEPAASLEPAGRAASLEHPDSVRNLALAVPPGKVVILAFPGSAASQEIPALVASPERAASAGSHHNLVSVGSPAFLGSPAPPASQGSRVTQASPGKVCQVSLANLVRLHPAEFQGFLGQVGRAASVDSRGILEHLDIAVNQVIPEEAAQADSPVQVE